MNSNETSLLIERRPHVARVTLNRPELRNAFSEELINELTTAFRGFSTDEQLRCVVLAASGKAFCAGADLNWMRQMAHYSHDDNLADASRLADMLFAIYQCPVPVIARVQGDVYAGGVGLVAVSDIVVAVDSAHFCLSEARLGLLPATISPYVIKTMGEQAARRYFVTAERFTASKAHALGMVHELVKPEELGSTVDAMVASIVNNGPQAVRACKKLVIDFSNQAIDAKLRADSAQRIAKVRASAEGKEGVQSFLNKREPDWLVKP